MPKFFWRDRPSWEIKGLTNDRDAFGRPSIQKWQTLTADHESLSETRIGIERYRQTGYWSDFRIFCHTGWELNVWRFRLTYQREKEVPHV